MNKGWIGVDLDGTLAYYDHWKGPLHIGKPIKEMVDRVNAWLDSDIEVKIFTARVADPEEAALSTPIIQQFCRVNFNTILEITCKKDKRMISCWDDRATQVIPNTGRSLEEIYQKELDNE